MTRSFLRFCLTTVLSMVVNFGLTIALHELARWPEELAYAVALVTVLLMNFVLLRSYVFSARHIEPGRQLALFALSTAGFRLSEYLAFLLLHTWLGMYYVLAMFLVQGTAFVTKFFYYGRLVFPDRRDGEPKA